MDSLNGTFFVVIISFFVFAFLMKAIYFQPIQQIKAARDKKREDDLASTRQFSQEQLSLVEGYEGQLADARRKAQALVAEKQLAAKSSAFKTVQDARSTAQKDVDTQIKDLEAWREEAYAKLTDERKLLSQIILNKVAGEARVAVK